MSVRIVLSRAKQWPRRSLALLLLMLQMGVAISPVMERAGRQTVTHAEQRGTRHAQAHNEATCALCAARSIQAAVSSSSAVPASSAVAQLAATSRLMPPASRDPSPSNATRAPPTLS